MALIRGLKNVLRTSLRLFSSSKPSTQRIINFSPGPGALAEEVILEAQAELYNYKGCGLGVMEMSHVSDEYLKIITETREDLREIMQIPDNYHVLFLQGGGSGQFSGVPLNLCKNGSERADYVVTGYWSDKAATEAELFCKPHRVNAPGDQFTGITPESEWKRSRDAKYLLYCTNETIHGIEFHHIPDSGGVDLVCDMSSSICSRPVDVSKFGVIFAGAHKNIGPAGVTIVIVRDDLLADSSRCPGFLNYKKQAECASLYNTPPAFSIYVCGLVLKWLKKQGGLVNIEKKNITKSSLVYQAIDESNGFYLSAVDKSARSRMNIPFTITGRQGNKEGLEQRFVAEGRSKGLMTLNGHRFVGGLRASLYNAITVENAQTLVDFMRDFQQRHQ